MNAYTTRGQARIQPRDIAAVPRGEGPTPGASLAALERQRGCQAEAEVNWLLKQHGVTPQTRVALLRQRIGAALLRAKERLAGVPQTGISPEPVSPAASRQGGAPAW